MHDRPQAYCNVGNYSGQRRTPSRQPSETPRPGRCTPTAHTSSSAHQARWRKCGPAAQRRANGVAYSADNRASGLLRRLPEVLPRGLRRLWDGAPCPITLAQFPARQHLAGKIRFWDPALYYNYPLFTRLIHLLGARLPLFVGYCGFLNKLTFAKKTAVWSIPHRKVLWFICK